MTVDISKPDFVSLWSASTRTKVNKAVREELVVDRGKNLLPDILRLFSYTAEKKGLMGFSVSDFETFENYECSAVILNGTMLCGHVWLLDDEEEAAPAEESSPAASPAKAYDPNDPMAWLTSGGIEFDDSAEAVKPSLFEDNEPTALPSRSINDL